MSLLLVAGAKLASQPFNEPRRAVGAVAAALVATTIATTPINIPFAERITLDKWQQPFSEPLRTKPLNPAQRQTLATPTFVASNVEIITVDKWHRPFVEPVRPTSLSQALRYEVSRPAFFFADVRLDQWNQPFAAPRPRRQDPKLAGLQWQARVGADPFPGVFVDRWQQPFAEPQRARSISSTLRHETTKASFFNVATPVTTWRQPWAEPRRPVGIKSALAPVTGFTIPVVASLQNLVATLYVDPDVFGNAIAQHVIGLSNPIFSGGITLGFGSGITDSSASHNQITVNHAVPAGLTDNDPAPNQITVNHAIPKKVTS